MSTATPAAPSSLLEMATNPGEVPLRVLTFNLWGIFNSKMRAARMQAFATKIDHYDVLLLQEQFSDSDFDLIRQSASPAVQRSYYFERFCSSFYGSGCAVISRYPIRQVFFHTFPLQGYPEMILHGDFFANKGAAMVRIMVPVPCDDGTTAIKVQEVTLYTTHLVAIYQKVGELASWKRERYLPFRISQAISLANFILSTSRPGDRIIIGGDFNCSQRSLEVQTLLVLLKRHGYNMRSVLPPPRALLDEAKTEQEREHGLRLFTFSDRNAFNSMKTSYFKLLKLEAEIPSQIDHLFFTSSAFSLCEFKDCPDVAKGYPCTVGGSPSGLVVFTGNEVYVPPQRTWYGSLWHQLLTGQGRVARGGKQSCSTAREEFFYPLSDHFGVAARLGMRLEEPGSPSSVMGCGAEMRHAAASTLTADEAKVLQTVEAYLEDYVQTLRAQVMVSRYMAVTSALVIITDLWLLSRLRVERERYTAAALEMLYDVAVNRTRSEMQLPQPHSGTAATGVGQQLRGALNWTARHLRQGFTPPSAGESVGAVSSASQAGERGAAGSAKSSASTAASPSKDAVVEKRGGGKVTVEPLPDFAALAQSIAWQPLWASTGVTSLLHIAAAIVGTASLAIGMFQRAGNANILAAQVDQLKQL